MLRLIDGARRGLIIFGDLERPALSRTDREAIRLVLEFALLRLVLGNIFKLFTVALFNTCEAGSFLD